MAQVFTVAGTALAEATPPAGTALTTPAVLQINATQPCPSGGNVGIAGLASGFMDMDGNGSASADVMVTLTSCGSVPVNGQPLVLNGAPYLSITSMASWAGFQLTSASMTFSGAFCWDDGCAQPTGTGDGNKVCDIRVTFQLAGQPSGSGHICDTEVNFGH